MRVYRLLGAVYKSQAGPFDRAPRLLTDRLAERIQFTRKAGQPWAEGGRGGGEGPHHIFPSVVCHEIPFPLTEYLEIPVSMFKNNFPIPSGISKNPISQH